MKRRALFAGLARDCAPHLPGVLANLAAFAETYDEASFLFVVSDTSDDSRAILDHWLAGGRPGKVVDFGTLAERIPKRTERIAHLRNAYLDMAREAPWADGAYLVVVDLDDVLGSPVPADRFARAAAWLEADPRRAGVFASATPRYYDVWALRHDRWCPRDCWHAIWERPPHQSFENAKFREVFARQIEIPPDLAPIAVRSAFGGLGIYRLSFALGARYDGVDASGREVSEHVAFNEAIRRADGELHIFPALQVQAPREHLYQPRDFEMSWRLRMAAWRILDQMSPPWRRMFARR